MKKYLNVKVTGFRSLRNTTFRINEGLNVLVGPNGSGKTNVAALLDFVSTFIQSGLYAAVAGAGGAVRVFSFESLQNDDDKPVRMTVSINGKVGYTSFDEAIASLNNKGKRQKSNSRQANSEQPKYSSTEFSYFLSLVLDKSKFVVAVENESLEWKLVGKGQPAKQEHARASAFKTNDSSCSISIDQEMITERFSQMFTGTLMEALIDSHKSKSDFSDSLNRNAISGNSLFRILTPFVIPDITDIQPALAFDRSSNIIPNKVREDQDIASSGAVTGDGAGVITKLYKLSEGKSGTRRKHGRVSSKYERILDGFFKINEHIGNLSIKPNLRTGKLDATLTVGDAKSKIEVPFSWASDGTAKWLAILTLLRVRDSGYCIEEPENYIHPAAQRMFISILRDIVSGKDKPFYIINTHSETIVNELVPQELLICDYDNGTRIRRVSHPERVRSVINETGFGLGHLYANQRV